MMTDNTIQMIQVKSWFPSFSKYINSSINLTKVTTSSVYAHSIHQPKGSSSVWKRTFRMQSEDQTSQNIVYSFANQTSPMNISPRIQTQSPVQQRTSIQPSPTLSPAQSYAKPERRSQSSPLKFKRPSPPSRPRSASSSTSF
ncbi:Hypothetical_protein [Hexamita inflata]|uniref:Hypothetical_protein n=1 Tax=Hexamita inflata TaxID=28002 RepID=A0AA86UA26_9EUKA|nr:Hypothetical protein HINF_LOCUS34829 [Hexamita inflata]